MYWVNIRTVRTPPVKAMKKAARVSRGELLHGTFCPWGGGGETEKQTGADNCRLRVALKRQDRTLTGDIGLRVGMRSCKATVDGSAEMKA